MRTSRLLSGKRCLLAEANLHERRQVTSVLRGSGITHTQSYSNGIDALEDIALNEFHFAIVSENLDGLNGRELVSMIRRHKLKTVNQIPIIFMKSAIRKRDVAEIAAAAFTRWWPSRSPPASFWTGSDGQRRCRAPS